MKKEIVVVLMIMVCLIATGCSDKKKENQNVIPAVTKVTLLSSSNLYGPDHSGAQEFTDGITEEATIDEKEAIIADILASEAKKTVEQTLVPVELESQIKQLEEMKTNSKVNWEFEKAKDAEESAYYILQDLLSTSKNTEGFVKSAWMGQIDSIERKAQLIRNSQDKVKRMKEQTTATLDAQIEEVYVTQQAYEKWLSELEPAELSIQDFITRAEQALDHAFFVIDEGKLQLQKSDENLLESLEKVESYLEQAKAVLTAV
ncbi:hypothetical protein M2444_004788 [Paenibacillus sp. PastF-3]|uniref:hypothetical protein n=1 Tax=Paenibacillus sp. PastF-3 TaxID=2940626 RepID=UPI00247622F1|nr:hypothetical protein [Paenibacillus sp. PastF-3]MDH6372959.1 hypothetical protein [Paenibacillus sp. PastF-3]